MEYFHLNLRTGSEIELTGGRGWKRKIVLIGGVLKKTTWIDGAVGGGEGGSVRQIEIKFQDVQIKIKLGGIQFDIKLGGSNNLHEGDS